MEQINPITVVTHALVSSLITGTLSFVGSIVGGLVVKPMADAIANQLTTMIEGGIKALSNDDVPPPLFKMLAPPFPPPIFFSVTPDGQIQMSISADKVLEQFMPMLFHPNNTGGNET